MVNATKDLSVLGSILVIDASQTLDGSGHHYGSFRYIQGTGTIVLEASHNGTNWFGVVDMGGNAVGNLTGAGTTFFRVHGYKFVRARNTVVGAGNLVSIGLS